MQGGDCPPFAIRGGECPPCRNCSVLQECIVGVIIWPQDALGNSSDCECRIWRPTYEIHDPQPEIALHSPDQFGPRRSTIQPIFLLRRRARHISLSESSGSPVCQFTV